MIALIPWTVFAAYVIVQMFGFILRARSVDAEVVCAGIATFLMLGMLWGFVFELVDRLVPGSFVFTGGSDRTMNHFEAAYFSFGNLTGMNFGDITPVSHAARTLAMTEAMVGMFYVTI